MKIRAANFLFFMKVNASLVMPWSNSVIICAVSYPITVLNAYGGDGPDGVVIFTVHDLLQYVQSRIDGEYRTFLMAPLTYYSDSDELVYIINDPDIAYIVANLKTELGLEDIVFDPDDTATPSWTLDRLELDELLVLNGIEAVRPNLFYSTNRNVLYHIDPRISASVQYDFNEIFSIALIFDRYNTKRVDEAVDDHTGDELVTLLNRFKEKITKALKVLLNAGSAEILSFDTDGAYVRTEDGIYHVPYAL